MAGLRNGSPSHVQLFKAEMALAKPRLKGPEAVLISQAAVQAYQNSFRPPAHALGSKDIFSSPNKESASRKFLAGTGSISFTTGLAASPEPARNTLKASSPGSVSTCTMMARAAPIPSIDALVSEVRLKEIIQQKSAAIACPEDKAEINKKEDD